MSALKDRLRPIYYGMGLNRNRWEWLSALGIADDTRIDIGACQLVLQRRFRHEADYARRRAEGALLCLDEAVARAFIQEGDLSVDLGANIGLTAAIYVACGAREVLAIEANPEVYARLSAHVAGEGRITCRNLACAGGPGEVALTISAIHNQGSSIDPETVDRFPFVFGAQPEVAVVPSDSLDNLVDEEIGFMKIDVEGAETAVLEGMTRILAEAPPRVIQVETYGEKAAVVDARLAPLYRQKSQVAIRHTPFAAEIIEAGAAAPPGFELTENYIYH